MSFICTRITPITIELVSDECQIDCEDFLFFLESKPAYFFSSKNIFAKNDPTGRERKR